MPSPATPAPDAAARSLALTRHAVRVRRHQRQTRWAGAALVAGAVVVLATVRPPVETPVAHVQVAPVETPAPAREAPWIEVERLPDSPLVTVERVGASARRGGVIQRVGAGASSRIARIDDAQFLAGLPAGQAAAIVRGANGKARVHLLP